MATNDLGPLIEILLIDDSPGDVRLMLEAFHEANKSLNITVATDGVEAMAFLRREGVHVDAPRPDLILLDLNMPRMDGREVLALLKSDEDLGKIPVLVLTTSDAERDIAECYALGANCYLAKPVQLEHLDALVKTINDFWIGQIRLPADRYSVRA